jgi:glycosyltransferase involved in cell wall biosynthesis
MLLGLLAEAKRQGHRTEAIFGATTRGASWLDDFERAGIPVTLGPASASRVRLGRWLDDYLGDDPEPVVLHTHFTTWDVPALIAARGRDAAVFWHVHSALPRDPLVVARTALKFGVLGHRAAGLLCPAPNIVDGARKRLAPRDRTHFIPSSLDLASFPRLDASKRAKAREELGIPLDAKVLLHFGWHWHLKGSDIFLEVLSRLAADDAEIIGIDRGGSAEMTDRAAELGIADRFRLIPPVEDVRTVHGAADVMVSSSREEGMAYAVLESLASGTPVVATAIPGHAFIGEQVDACRLTSTDPGELATAARETLDRTPAEAEREAQEAHSWMEQNLAHAPVARRVIRLYSEALPSKPTVPVVERRAKARPRLIHLCNFANPQAGSFVPMVASVIEYAREQGWDAEAIFARPADDTEWLAELRERGIVFRSAPAGSRSELVGWARELAKERQEHTIVHTHFTRYDLPMALAAKPGSLDVIWHEHTALSSRPQMVARNALKFAVGGRRVAAILCPAPDLAEAVIGRGAPADRVRFVPNAINAARFPVIDPARRAQARASYGIDPEALVILSFGWHWDLKGGELFQRAASELVASTDREVVALHSTRAPEAKALVKTLGLEGTVRLIDQTSDVLGLMAATDVFVAASRAEGGTPLAVLEALASGLPVVASDLPSHRFVAERVPGMRLVVREPVQMARAILDASMPPGAENGRSGQLGHAAIERHFSLEHWCSALFETYEQVFESSRAGRLY